MWLGLIQSIQLIWKNSIRVSKKKRKQIKKEVATGIRQVKAFRWKNSNLAFEGHVGSNVGSVIERHSLKKHSKKKE
jgi:hypothetical protein